MIASEIAAPALADPPSLRKQGDATQLIVSGEPTLLSIGELGNSGVHWEVNDRLQADFPVNDNYGAYFGDSPTVLFNTAPFAPLAVNYDNTGSPDFTDRSLSTSSTSWKCRCGGQSRSRMLRRTSANPSAGS